MLTIKDFLKEKGVLELFIKNTMVYWPEDPSHVQGLLDADHKDVFSVAFVWNSTPEGEEFWKNLREEYGRIKSERETPLTPSGKFSNAVVSAVSLYHKEEITLTDLIELVESCGPYYGFDPDAWDKADESEVRDSIIYERSNVEGYGKTAERLMRMELGNLNY